MAETQTRLKDPRIPKGYKIIECTEDKGLSSFWYRVFRDDMRIANCGSRDGALRAAVRDAEIRAERDKPLLTRFERTLELPDG